MGETYLTKAGLKKLQTEHKALLRQKNALRKEVSKAAAMGDLRENAEYHAARERLQQVGQRLGDLEVKFSSVQLIDNIETKAGEARIGMKVTIEERQSKEKDTYVLVGADEATETYGGCMGSTGGSASISMPDESVAATAWEPAILVSPEPVIAVEPTPTAAEQIWKK